MQLFQQIFAQAITDGKIQVTFNCADRTVAEVVEGICYQTLARIQTIIRDDSLSDKECFSKIEEIIQALERNGINCGVRHDFG